MAYNKEEAMKYFGKRLMEGNLRRYSTAARALQGYSQDYMSSWHSAYDIQQYQTAVEAQRNLAKTLSTYYKLYGTDEQKAKLPEIDSAAAEHETYLKNIHPIIQIYADYDNASAFLGAKAKWEFLENADLPALKQQYAQAEKDRWDILNPFRYHVGGWIEGIVKNEEEIKELEKIIKEVEH